MRVDIVIRYIEVDFTFGLPDYVRYVENSLYRGSFYRSSIPYILPYLWLEHRISFVISRTSLNRGSLNRGSTVVVQNFIQILLIDTSETQRSGRHFGKTASCHATHCLSQIRVRALVSGVVDKIATFVRFSEVLKENFKHKQIIKFL